MIRMFRSKDSAEAMEFTEPSTIQEIAKFTGLRVTAEYNPDGSIARAGLIRSAVETPLVVHIGQYVYKENNGTIGVCDYEQLIEKYEEVTEETAS
ncbi:MAG: hypothetical protein KZY74_05405 [Paenibacillaceae bacterium]|nr:hypothetical protein [Paenibacillaceae bacterium]